MEAIVIILVLVAVLAGPVGLTVGIVCLRRIDRLRAELGLAATTRATAPSSTPPVAVTSRVASKGSAGLAERLRRARSGRGEPSSRGEEDRGRPLDLEAILGGQWLTWIGVLALFFGTAFFLGVDLGASFLAGLPQLIIGLAVALAFCVIGRAWSRSESLHFLGLGLLGGGVALLFLVAYSAYGFHHLVPLGAVLPMLLLVAVAGAWLALERHSLTIASLTLTGALLTPVLFPHTEGLTNALLPYLVAVNLGAVLVGLRRGWAGLPLASFAGASLLIALWMDAEYETSSRLFAFVFVGASWLIFALSPRFRGLYGRRNLDVRPRRFGPPAEFWSVARGILTVANGLLFGLFCYHVLRPDALRYQGLALGLLAFAYLLLSFTVYRSSANARISDAGARMNFYTAIALAALAVPVQFDLSWITLGWTALAGVLLVHGILGADRNHRIAGLTVLVLALVRVLAFDLPISQRDPEAFHFLLNGQFLTGLAVTGLLAWSGWSYQRGRFELARFEEHLIVPLVLLAALVLWWKGSFEIAAWWKLHGLGTDLEYAPQRMASISLFWLLTTGAVLATGLLTRFRPLRLLGVALLTLTTAKILLWDILSDRAYEAGLRPFFNFQFSIELVLPVLLAGVAWSFHRYRARVSAGEYKLPMPLVLSALCALIWIISAEILYHFSFRAHAGMVSSERESLLTLSLVWAFYAAAVIAVGFLAQFKPMRLLGITMLAITIAKVFVVDLTSLEQGYRIAAFVGLGVLVLAISLLYQKRRPRSV